MNHNEIKRLVGHGLNVAIAKSLGWACWNFHDGERYEIFPPSSRKWAFPNMVEVVGKWPASAGLDLMPAENWAVNLTAAWNLTNPEWIWKILIIPPRLQIRLYLPLTAAARTQRRDAFDAFGDMVYINMNMRSFSTETEAQATARCRAYLLAKLTEEDE